MSGRPERLRRALRRAWDLLVASGRLALGIAGFYVVFVLGIGYVAEAGWQWLALLIAWPFLGFIVTVWALYEGGNVGPGGDRRRR